MQILLDFSAKEKCQYDMYMYVRLDPHNYIACYDYMLHANIIFIACRE